MQVGDLQGIYLGKDLEPEQVLAALREGWGLKQFFPNPGSNPGNSISFYV